MSNERSEIFVGFDWATQVHHAWVDDASGNALGDKAVPHRAEDLASFCDWLSSLCAGLPSAVRIAIEVPHGSVVETLMDRGFTVYAINPKQLDRFRDRLTVCGVKDDRQDARVLASSLRTDRRAFRELEREDPIVIRLREWSRMREDLQRERVLLVNRFREQLRRYYPQFIDLAEPLGANWTLALWEKVPSASIARKVRGSSIQKILKAHRIRKIDASTVLEALRVPGPKVAPGAEDASRAHIEMLKERIQIVNKQIKIASKHIEKHLEELSGKGEDSPGEKGGQRDVEIISTMPGIGPIILATLLVEAWRPLRDREYQALRALSEIAPVTRRSGKKILVMMRKACNGRLRNALYHWGRVAIQKDPYTRAKYTKLRARGKTHGQALRSVVDRLLGVLCRMLRDQTDFDPERRQVAA